MDEWDEEPEPQEICCGSCDGLIGYAYPDDPGPFPRYCGGQWCKRFPPM